jgi:hypothetical protein
VKAQDVRRWIDVANGARSNGQPDILRETEIKGSSQMSFLFGDEE